jgi:hypothetical protein
MRDIKNLKRPSRKMGSRCIRGKQLGEVPRQANNKLLSLPYGARSNRSKTKQDLRANQAAAPTGCLAGPADPIKSVAIFTGIGAVPMRGAVSIG